MRIFKAFNLTIRLAGKMLFYSLLISSCFSTPEVTSDLDSEKLHTGLERVESINFSVNGDLLLIAGHKDGFQEGLGSVEIWDVHSWERIRTLSPYGNPTIWAEFMPGNQDNLISFDAFGGIYLWDTKTEQKIETLKQRSDSYKISTIIALSPPGQHLALGYYSGELKMLDLEAKEEHEIHLDSASNQWRSLAFSDDAKLLVGVKELEGYGSLVEIIDLEQKEIIKSIDFKEDEAIEAVLFGKGKFLAISGANGFFEIGDLQVGDFVAEVDFDDKKIIRPLVLSSDKETLAIGSNWTNGWDSVFGKIDLLDIESGEVKCSIGDILGVSNVNSDIALSPDGNMLATTEAGDIRVWNIQKC